MIRFIRVGEAGQTDRQDEEQYFKIKKKYYFNRRAVEEGLLGSGGGRFLLRCGLCASAAPLLLRGR